MVIDPSRKKALLIRCIVGPSIILAILGLIWVDFGLDQGRGRFGAVVLGILAVVGVWEYVGMLKMAGRPVAGRLLLLATLVLHVIALLPLDQAGWTCLDHELYAPVLIAITLMVLLVLQALTPKGMATGLESAGATLVGLILLSWPLYFAQGLCLRYLPWLIWLLIVVKGGDIGAYLVGTFFGKNKMILHVSPGKTWEGAAGGIGCSALLGLAFSFMIGPEEVVLPFYTWLCMGIMAGVMAQVSDLVESMIKRLCGAKDSSQLLPVHGGILDLTDSFMLSTPPLFILVVLLTGDASV